ncbi:MAG: sigma-70 family RNA polymerase sigma factor [Planctomyces sp.]|nr:sigma-70 family RNA polymerase sigma factor [Planctomyces sp.]
MSSASITRVLWKQARAGDRAAYDRLFALHVDHLLMFIRVRLGAGLAARVDPEDVLQETYLSAHRSFDQFDYVEDGAFLRWLCRIAENRLRDSHDRFAAGKRQAVEVPRSSPTGPVSAFARIEDRARVEQALQQLEPDHRLVLLHRYFEGLSAEDTAERMERTSGAVRKLAARALVELGKLL